MTDTIAAISTPAGEGGIGIVRVSGPASLDIMKRIMAGCPEEPVARHAYYGRAVSPDTHELIDECIFIYMKAPHTYTCEDVLEIQAHGSIVSLRNILRGCLSAGARMAEPGEFTKIAFLNGRIDLAQAEAVIDLITAKSDLPQEIAAGQLQGRLSAEVSAIRRQLVSILAEMAVNIDFPDEDIEQFEYHKFVADLIKTRSKVQALLATADSGRIVRDGLKVAIVGKPNVGKSSMMNALLGTQRAIVTDIPGTTRDTIEEAITINGIPIILVDTAGMRESDDVVESIGIERSMNEISAADLVLFVLDSSRPLDEEDKLIAEKLNGKVIVVLNKTDLPAAVTRQDVSRLLGNRRDEGGFTVKILETDLTTTDGADIVKDRIGQLLDEGRLRSENGNTVTNERHRRALERSLDSLDSAVELLNRHEAIEIAEVEVHDAYNALGEIIGESAGEEILDAVFTRFCLGK